MVTLSEVQQKAMDLSEAERAELASSLLRSLPREWEFDEDEEDDGGLAEALRRDAEMDADPSACLTLEEFKRAVGR